MNYGNGDPALSFDAFAMVALFCGGCWAFIRWLSNAPITPDPWGDQVAAEIAKDETPPLCHRCLTPQEPLADFCPDCGAPVGMYTNWLPYPSLFSVGDALRMGTSGTFKSSTL